MNDELPDRYLLAVGRSVGIPEMWLEDYIQEVRLLQWLKPSPYPKVQAKTKAIDFSRRFGPHSRNNIAREARPLEDVQVNRIPSRAPSEAVICALMDAAAAIAKLPPYQRWAITRRAGGWPMTSALSSLARRARRKLKRTA